MNEQRAIEIITSLVPTGAFPAAPGDDAAILDLSRRFAVTTDTLIEGVDFFPETPRGAAGFKALAANLSDLAAMGARPDHFLLTLGLGSNVTEAQVRALAEGIGEIARRGEITLVGGDLTQAPQLLISITALGRFDHEPLMRSGAAPGERIFVSRPLGAASCGLELLRRGWRWSDGPQPPGKLAPTAPVAHMAGRLLEAQLFPEPETRLGVELAAGGVVGACIDISDGLSIDLHRLCRASGVGARVDWERIPALDGLEQVGPIMQLDVRNAVLHGGEELALLFTSSMTESKLSELVGRPVFSIGQIEPGDEILLVSDERTSPLEPLGFDHFSN